MCFSCPSPLSITLRPLLCFCWCHLCCRHRFCCICSRCCRRHCRCCCHRCCWAGWWLQSLIWAHFGHVPRHSTIPTVWSPSFHNHQHTPVTAQQNIWNFSKRLSCQRHLQNYVSCSPCHLFILINRLQYHLNVAARRHESRYIIGIHGNPGSSMPCPSAGKGEAPTSKHK